MISKEIIQAEQENSLPIKGYSFVPEWALLLCLTYALLLRRAPGHLAELTTSKTGVFYRTEHRNTTA